MILSVKLELLSLVIFSLGPMCLVMMLHLRLSDRFRCSCAQDGRASRGERVWRASTRFVLDRAKTRR